MAAVEAVAGLPVPPAGLVTVVVAVQRVVVPVLKLVSVIALTPKTGLPAASWTWTTTSHVEPGVMDVVGVLVQVLDVIASLRQRATADLGLAAPRPKRCGLRADKLREALGEDLTDPATALRELAMRGLGP